MNITLDEFDARILDMFLADNWGKFIRFCEAHGIDAEAVSKQLKGEDS